MAQFVLRDARTGGGEVGKRSRWAGMVLTEIAFVLASIVLVKKVGTRWLPLFIPKSRRATLLAGVIGAGMGYLVGRLLWPLWLIGQHFSPPWVVTGVVLGIFLAGLGPFLRILFRL